MIALKFLAIYLLFINVVAVIVCITDKIKARLDKWRVTEKTLVAISVLGGAFGMYATMLVIRHKTKHNKFMLGLPFVILLQCVIIIMILQRAT